MRLRCSNEEENIDDSDIDIEIENTTDFDLVEGADMNARTIFE